MAGGKNEHQLKIAKAKTKRGRRELQKREPKLVEDAKRALFLYGNKTSQVVKDVLSDFSRLKKEEACKLTKKNAEVMPFETGGEQALERHAAKADCSLFAFGSHSKKRPNNVVLGRLFNHHLYDMVEFGVAQYTPLSAFGSAAATGSGNKPEMVFVGERFENDPACRLARSLLLDFFRGQQVEQVNLKGLDRVLFAAAPADGVVLLRQYRIGYKKSGTNVPRVLLQEMGPRLDLRLRRFREAPPDMAKDAMKQPQLGKRKKKKVSSDLLDGKVGRIYMPKQDMGGLPLRKMKGLKRERRQEAAAAAAAKKAKPAEANGA